MKLTSVCIAVLMMVATNVQSAPVIGGVRVQIHSNPIFRPNATRQVRKAVKKFNRSLESHNKFNNLDGVYVPFTDVGTDIEYYASVTVGTPGQTFKLDFDTGSSDLWFASTSCRTCQGKTKYNPKMSSTYKADGRPWKISFGDQSSSSGILGVDTVNLGGLIIQNQVIELATKISAQFQTDSIDGLLGLGFNSITTTHGVSTPIDNLISQGLISNPIFGVYLGKTANGGGGEYVFGGYDSSKVGGQGLTTVPVDSSQGWYQITIDSVKSNSQNVGNSFSGILDTGTTLLLFPSAIVSAIAQQYGATGNKDGSYNLPTCDASKLSDLVLTIAGADFKVPAADLIFATNNDGTCQAGFGDSQDTIAILGDVFIKNNYVVFNQQVPQVQLAPLTGI